MSIANKLTYLEETKDLIKEKLNDLGAEITDDTFREYVEKLEEIYRNYPKTIFRGSDITLPIAKKEKIEIFPIGNTTQNTSILPSEYQQVEYIENTGTQYIDTNYTPVQGDDLEFKNVTINTFNGTLFSAGTENYQLILLGFGSVCYYKYFQTGDAVSISFSTITNGNIKVLNGNLYINNVLKAQADYGGAVNTTLNIFQRANNTSNLIGKIGEIIISNNGIIKRDFIPCYRKSDNEIGLYDLVNNTFYTNAGTGTFLKGNDVVIPNPDYPQPIKNVTGNNNVIIRGKNILEIKNTTRTINGVTFTINEDKSITINGTASATTTFPLSRNSAAVGMDDIQLKANTTYTISSTNPTNKLTFQVYFNKNGTTTYSTSTFTTNNSTKLGAYIKVDSGVTIDNLTASFQIEQNPTTTSYEPYIEPIEKKLNLKSENLAYTGWAEDFVTRINDNNKAKIENFDNKNCLFYNANASTPATETNYFFKTNWKENTQYTFSLDIYSNQGFSNLRIQYTDGTYEGLGKIDAKQWVKKQYTSAYNKTIEYLNVLYSGGYSYIDLDTFMIKEGSTPSTEYEPYYNYELAHTYTTKQDWYDYIEGSKDNWKLIKQNKRLKITGSSGFGYYGDAGTDSCLYRARCGIPQSAAPSNLSYHYLNLVKCDKFGITRSDADITTKDIMQVAQNDGRIALFTYITKERLGITDSDTAAEKQQKYKDWFTQNQPEVIYPSTGVEEITITQPALIKQLNELYSMMTTGKTITIKTESEEENAQLNLEIRTL